MDKNGINGFVKNYILIGDRASRPGFKMFMLRSLEKSLGVYMTYEPPGGVEVPIACDGICFYHEHISTYFDRLMLKYVTARFRYEKIADNRLKLDIVLKRIFNVHSICSDSGSLPKIRNVNSKIYSLLPVSDSKILGRRVDAHRDVSFPKFCSLYELICFLIKYKPTKEYK